MSSASTSDNVVPRGPGRPNTVTEQLPLVVSVDCKDAGQSTDDASSLYVPNRLLFTWYCDKTQICHYLSLINAAMVGQIAQLKSGNDTLAKKLHRRAGSVYGTAKKKGGRARMEFLKQKSIISVSHHDFVQVPQLQQEVKQLQDQVGDLEDDIPKLQQEVEELQDQVADLEYDLTRAIEELVDSQDAITNMSRQLNQVLLEQDDMVNAGKAFDDVGAKQKKRKLAQFQRAADAALWFGESFGLIPTQLMLRSSACEEPIIIPLRESPTTVPDTQPTREVDEFCAMQTLYLLDRFGVSDEFYHELTQVYPSLQRSYVVKAIRKKLNSEVDIVRIENGAYRPFKDTLLSFLAHIEPTSDSEDVCVKISGDGARFSNSSSFLLLSFSFPGSSENVLSGAGNHTFAAIRGTESYSLLASLTDIMSEINSLLKEPVLDGKRLRVVFGGDYKFLLLSMGMNAAHSTYACLWCTVSSAERWDMSVDEKEYTEKKARTLQKMQELSACSYSSCARHLGCVLPPLINIPLDYVVLDELHLLLRIMDVLIRNLVLYADGEDHRQKTHHGAESRHLKKLEQTIRSCGVCFQIWQNREPTGKPIPGSFDWTPLSGKHKLQVLKNLPTRMDTILEENIAPSVAKLWNDFLSLYSIMSSASPTLAQVSSFHDKAKQWVRDFLCLGKKLQGYQQKHVTPYMHCMVYHVPSMLKKYGNLRQFSGQGVEKNNDDSKRHYFSTNKHDAPGEIIRSEYRQEALRQGVGGHPTCVHQKRSYNKIDSEYWDQGGIQAVRKRSRGDQTCSNSPE